MNIPPARSRIGCKTMDTMGGTVTCCWIGDITICCGVKFKGVKSLPIRNKRKEI